MNVERLLELSGDWQVHVEIYETYVLKRPKSIPEITERILKSRWGKQLSDTERKPFRCEISIFAQLI
jgi:hypothetical protein